jgi:hypothetical protein
MVVHVKNLAGLMRLARKLLFFPRTPLGFLGVRGSAVRLASSHIEPSRYVLSILSLGIIDTARRLLEKVTWQLGKNYFDWTTIVT